MQTSPLAWQETSSLASNLALAYLEIKWRACKGAAGGLDRTTRGAFGDALSAFQLGQQGARAGAQGIAGLGHKALTC